MAILLCLLLLSPATSEIKNVKITADARPMILLEKFGFTHSGHFNIAVSSVSITSSLSLPDPSHLGFFLLSEDSLNKVIIEFQQTPLFCVLESKYINLLFTFRDLSPPPHSSFNNSYPVTVTNSPNGYNLFFTNCEFESQVTMEVRTDIYSIIDIDAEGAAIKNYLSAELTHLPTIMSLFSLTYFLFLVFWTYYIFLTYKRSSSIHRIHLLMSLLLLIKALNLIFSAADNYNVKITGTPHGWLRIVFYVFQFIEVVLLYTVIVLLATGNCFLLMIVIPLQLLASVAFVVISESGPVIKNWVIWNQCFLIVDMMCCCAIIFPLVRAIRSLRREASTTDLRKKLSKLIFFSLVYVGYICFTRIGVIVLRGMIVAYKYQWVYYAAKEMANLAFYIIMFYIFKPVGTTHG